MARLLEYKVVLTEKERDYLKKHTSSGKWTVRTVKRAQILLKTDKAAGRAGDEEKTIEEERIAREVGCSLSTVRNIKLRFAKGERLKVLGDKARSGRPKIIDGELEAHIVAIACSAPPEGRVRWTVRLIADKVVALTEVESCSRASVGRALKKMNLNLG